MRDQILARGRSAPSAVPVPEWGCTLFAHKLSASERLEWADANSAAALVGAAGRLRTMTTLAIRSLRDDAGEPVFLAEDAEAIEGMDGDVIERVLAEVAKVNGLDREAEGAAAKK